MKIKSELKQEIKNSIEKWADENHLWIDAEVNKPTETTMQTLSACNVFVAIDKVFEEIERIL